jgi:F0F1-type ATP synthase assembly protein I
MDDAGNRPNRPAPKSDRDGVLFLERAAKSFQENVTRAGPVALASYTLIGAILLFGGIGYVVDRWQGTDHWFLLGGLFLGLIVGFYELAKAVWPRSHQ